MSESADGQRGTAGEDDSHGGALTREDLIAVTTMASWHRFHEAMASYRAILRSVPRRDSMSDDRPPELRRLAKLLDLDKRRAVEAAADEASERVSEDMNRLFEDDESSDGTEAEAGIGHPFALEQVVALVVAGIGRDRFDQAEARLADVVGDDAAAARYAVEYSRWSKREPPSTVLGRALLPVVVASFEEMLGGLVRLWLTLYPEALNADKKPIESGVAWKFREPQDIRRWAVDKATGQFIADGLSEWNKKLKEKLKIHLDVLTEDWPKFIEAFARRHVVVHAGGIADPDYLGQLVADTERPARGTRLPCDKSYMNGVLDTFDNLGTVLAVVWLAHFLPRAEHAANLADPEVLRALEDRRWYDARTMAAAALTPLGDDHQHHQLRVNLWMARRELGEDWPQLRDEISRWEPPEADPEYAVAKAALLRDEQGILDALRRLQANGRPPATLAEWPLMRDMQERSKAVAAALRGRPGAGQQRHPRPNRGKGRRR